MRHGLAFLCLMALFVMSPAGVLACELTPARPVIHVTSHVTPVKFDTTRTIAELNQMDINTASPYPSNYHTDVGGVMSGVVSVDHHMKFRTRVDESTGNGCVMLTEVSVNIKVDPKIYIASDFQNQTCWFREIFAHESEHVDVDRALIEKYQNRFSDGLNLILMIPSDYTVNGVPATALESARHRLQNDIEQALGVLFTNLMQERQERQQTVDSIDEYARISKTCQVSS